VVFPVLLPYWVLFLPIPNPLVASPRPSKYRVVNCPVAPSDGYPSQRGLVAGVRLGSMAGYGLFCGGVAVSSYVHNWPPLLAYLPWLLGTPCTVISTSMSTTLGYFTVFPFVALPGRELSGVLQCAQL